jgi:hypothetical protein
MQWCSVLVSSTSTQKAYGRETWKLSSYGFQLPPPGSVTAAAGRFKFIAGGRQRGRPPSDRRLRPLHRRGPPRSPRRVGPDAPVGRHTCGEAAVRWGNAQTASVTQMDEGDERSKWNRRPGEDDRVPLRFYGRLLPALASSVTYDDVGLDQA